MYWQLTVLVWNINAGTYFIAAAFATEPQHSSWCLHNAFAGVAFSLQSVQQLQHRSLAIDTSFQQHGHQSTVTVRTVNEGLRSTHAV